MRIPSDISYIRKTSKEIEKFLKEHSVSESEIFDIRLCAEEAIKNAIIHGNKEKKNLFVNISYGFDDGKFIMEVEDEGEGFNPGELPDPTEKENILKSGGRGVFLIYKLMDKVEYKGRGNKAFMVKSIKYKKGGVNAH
jgi:serine/threonine-protein kinase RsbW